MTTLATAPAVLALVTLAKDQGMPKRLAAPLAVVLGVILAVADHALGATGAYAHREAFDFVMPGNSLSCQRLGEDSKGHRGETAGLSGLLSYQSSTATMHSVYFNKDSFFAH